MTSGYVPMSRSFETFILTNQIQMKSNLWNLSLPLAPFSCQSSKTSNGDTQIYDISDDIWHSILHYLDIQDFLSIPITCNYFHRMTNASKHNSINQYWKKQCIKVCKDIEILTFTTPNWHKFFINLLLFVNKMYTYTSRKCIIQHIDATSSLSSFDLKYTKTAHMPQFPLTIGSRNGGNYTFKMPLSSCKILDFSPVLKMGNLNINRNNNFNTIGIRNGRHNRLNTGININNNTNNNNYNTISKTIGNSIDCNCNYTYGIKLVCEQDNILMFKLLSNYLDPRDINQNLFSGSKSGQSLTLLGAVAKYGAVKIGDYLLNNNNININGNTNTNININNTKTCTNIAELVLNMNINQREYDNNTALILATIGGQIDIIKLLLKHPQMTAEGINMVNNTGNTALHCAVSKTVTFNQNLNLNFNSQQKKELRKKIVSLLLKDERININIANGNCNGAHTPLSMAVYNGFDDIATMIKEAVETKSKRKKNWNQNIKNIVAKNV